MKKKNPTFEQRDRGDQEFFFCFSPFTFSAPGEVPAGVLPGGQWAAPASGGAEKNGGRGPPLGGFDKSLQVVSARGVSSGKVASSAAWALMGGFFPAVSW